MTDADWRIIYADGASAYWEGVSAFACPYPQGSVAAAAWTEGWDDAARDEFKYG